jgi:hypothetical protein
LGLIKIAHEEGKIHFVFGQVFGQGGVRNDADDPTMFQIDGDERSYALYKITDLEQRHPVLLPWDG